MRQTRGKPSTKRGKAAIQARARALQGWETRRARERAEERARELKNERARARRAEARRLEQERQLREDLARQRRNAQARERRAFKRERDRARERAHVALVRLRTADELLKEQEASFVERSDVKRELHDEWLDAKAALEDAAYDDVDYYTLLDAIAEETDTSWDIAYGSSDAAQ